MEFYIKKLASVDSTNNWAKKSYAEHTIHSGAVIVSESQTHGRGQMQTLWHDQPGANLLFTVVLEFKKLRAIDFFALNQLASLALYDVLKLEFDVKIKWPNDIFIGNKKVAGILIENSLQGEWIKTSFIGIGLNVNQLNFPIGLSATSLTIESGKTIDKVLLLDEILSALQNRLNQIMGMPGLCGPYFKALLGVETYLKYKAKNETFLALIKNIEKDGRLILEEKETRQLKKFRFKEVQLLLD